MEKKTLYFAKVNLNSHIFEVYDDKEVMNKIKMIIKKNVREGVIFHREDMYQEGKSYEADYKFTQLHKNKFGTIAGRVQKTANIFVQKVDEGELKKRPVENDELITFYYDVDREIIAFFKTRRFGYVEICEAFIGLLNQCMGEDYKFNIALLRKGVNIDEIKEKVSRLKNIESLKINIIPPNTDDELMDEIIKNGGKLLDSMKASNITGRSIILSSKAPGGLKMDAKAVQDELDIAGNIHTKLSTEKATRNGYISVEAKSIYGEKYSTKDSAPITHLINEDEYETIHEFEKACKSIVLTVLSRLL